MFCDFEKAFGLDPEHNKQLEESMREAEKSTEEKSMQSAIVHGLIGYERDL